MQTDNNPKPTAGQEHRRPLSNTDLKVFSAVCIKAMKPRKTSGRQRAAGQPSPTCRHAHSADRCPPCEPEGSWAARTGQSPSTDRAGHGLRAVGRPRKPRSYVQGPEGHLGPASGPSAGLHRLSLARRLEDRGVQRHRDHRGEAAWAAAASKPPRLLDRLSESAACGVVRRAGRGASSSRQPAASPSLWCRCSCSPDTSTSTSGLASNTTSTRPVSFRQILPNLFPARL